MAAKRATRKRKGWHRRRRPIFEQSKEKRTLRNCRNLLTQNRSKAKFLDLRTYKALKKKKKQQSKQEATQCLKSGCLTEDRHLHSTSITKLFERSSRVRRRGAGQSHRPN